MTNSITLNFCFLSIPLFAQNLKESTLNRNECIRCFPLSPTCATFLQSLQHHNSPADWPRELLKPFTDYRLRNSSRLDFKKIFVLGLGFSVDDVIISACFHYFGQVYLALGVNPTNHSLAQVFGKTRTWSASLEPLIGFLAYLKPKLWLKNPSFDKNKKVTRKVWFALSRQILVSHNSAAGWASELRKPSKESEGPVA